MPSKINFKYSTLLLYGMVFFENLKSQVLAGKAIISSEIYLNKCCDFGYTFQNNLTRDLCVSSVPGIPVEDDQFNIPKELSASSVNLNVTLKFDPVKCESSLVQKYIVIESVREGSGFEPESNILFTPEGYVTIDGEYFYPPTSFCIDRANVSTIVVQLCPVPCNTLGVDVCLMKCCPLGQAVAKGLDDCVTPSKFSKWRPLQNLATSGNKFPHVLLNSPANHCEESNIAFILNSSAENAPSKNPDNYNQFKILSNGVVLFKTAIGTWEALPNNEFFCVDDVEPDSDNFLSNSILIYCAKMEDSRTTILFSAVYSGVMFLSSLFLLAASTVNFLLWRKQNIHTWTVQAYIVSLFFMYIFLGLSHVTSAFGYNGTYCTLIGGAAHYFFLSTFFWLSMINFDLWWKFRRLTARIGIPSGRKLRFFIYSALSMGTPVLIISSGILIPEFLNVENQVWPSLQYGATVCYLESSSLWAYLYGPVSAILGLNLILFFLTLHSLHVIKRSTRIATDRISTNRQSKDVTLFFKLFCITGVLWNFEVISYIVESREDRAGKLWYWSVLDVLNISQAVAIFFIFIWKRKIRCDLEKEYPVLKSFFSKFVHCCCDCFGRITHSEESPTNERKSSSSSTQTSQDLSQTGTEVSMSNFQVHPNVQMV